MINAGKVFCSRRIQATIRYQKVSEQRIIHLIHGSRTSGHLFRLVLLCAGCLRTAVISTRYKYDYVEPCSRILQSGRRENQS